eukprot:scpid35956/ scgid8650/ WD repeat-containing protein 27
MDLVGQSAAIPTAYLAARYQLCANAELLVLPGPSHRLSVYRLDDLCTEVVGLRCEQAHRYAVTGMSLSVSSNLLVTVSSDMLALWTNPCNLPDDVIEVYSNPGLSQCVTLSESEDYACLAVDNDVIVVNIMDRKLEATLQGHTAPVTAIKVLTDSPLTVVSVSEDRTFKVWDIEGGCLLYQSAVLSASPCLSLSLNSSSEELVIGFSDGMVRVFDTRKDHAYSCIHEINTAKVWTSVISEQATLTDTIESSSGAKIISSSTGRSAYNQQQLATPAVQAYNEPQDESMLASAGFAVLGLSILDASPDSAPSATSSFPPCASRQEEISRRRLRDILKTTGKLLVATAAYVQCFTMGSWQVEKTWDLRVPLPSQTTTMMESAGILPTPGAIMFSKSAYTRKVWCVSAGALVASATVLQFHFPVATDSSPQAEQIADIDDKHWISGGSSGNLAAADQSPDASATTSDAVSVLSSQPLQPSSVLAVVPLTPSSSKSLDPTGGPGRKHPIAGGKLKSGSAPSAKPGVKDQPLTFKSKVKSSGYTAAPRTKMFAPQTKSSPTMAKKPAAMKAGATGSALSGKSAYPLSAAAPVHRKACLPISPQQSAITKIQYSASGSLLACAMARKTLDVVRTPLNSTSKISTATGHDGAVVDLCWAAHGDRLVSAGTDRTVRMWSSSNLTEPLLVFDRQHHSATVSASRAGALQKKPTTDKQLGSAPLQDDNGTFTKDITHSRFYFLDKFVLIAHGNTFGLYQYNINTEKPDDIKRYQTTNKYKMSKQFQHSTAQAITALSCVNSFNSYIVLVAGSDKSVEVFDMNAGRTARSMTDVHTRSPYLIRQNEGSQFITHSSEAYDLFLTSALTDDIKLWDLRTNRCVRRYHGHMQRAHQVGMSFSPCSRFVAAASEDRSVYIYDIRQTAHLHRLSGHSDTVSDVTFNPKYPQLCCSTLDGRLFVYNDKPV